MLPRSYEMVVYRDSKVKKFKQSSVRPVLRSGSGSLGPRLGARGHTVQGDTQNGKLPFATFPQNLRKRRHTLTHTYTLYSINHANTDTHTNSENSHAARRLVGSKSARSQACNIVAARTRFLFPLPVLAQPQRQQQTPPTKH